MSEITLNVLDAERSIHAQVHGADGDRVVAVLAADPETIDELALALGRFLHQAEDGGFFDGWSRGTCHQPSGAGIVFVDLVGRLVVSRTTDSSFDHTGGVAWHDGHSASSRMLPYHLASDWQFSSDVESFEHLSAERRKERLSAEPLDARAVIYDRLPEFIVREVHDRQTELAGMDDDTRYELVRKIHARWLLTPRDDLGGRCPREMMIDDRHDHITWDLQDQSQRWSSVGHAPPGIPRESAAYCFGGFATHEIVLYYDLVRELLHECVQRLADHPIAEADLPAEADRLQRLRQEWMHGPQVEDLYGRSPASVIDRERRRLPECMSGEAAVIDPDCPLCQMMADGQFGPTFWHLDGCNMDDEFAFSFEPTREAWEEKQREYEEFNRKFEEQRKRDRDFVEGRVQTGEFLGVDDIPSRVWQTCFSSREQADDIPAGEAMPLMLFGIGACLGELGEDLKPTGDGAEQAQSLRSHFTELRRAVDDRNPWMAESAVARFCEELNDVSATRTELASKCSDLERQLDHLLSRCRETEDFDQDLPF